jgi:hypothetical protein
VREEVASPVLQARVLAVGAEKKSEVCGLGRGDRRPADKLRRGEQRKLPEPSREKGETKADAVMALGVQGTSAEGDPPAAFQLAPLLE